MRRLMWFSIGLCMACLLAVFFLPQRWLVGGALLGALAGGVALLMGRGGGGPMGGLAVLFPWGDKGARAARWAALGFGLGLIWCWAFEGLRLAPAREAEGRFQRVEAELCAYPAKTDYGYRVDCYVLVEGRQIKARLYLYGALPELEPGDKLAGPFTLRRADRTADGEARLDLQAKGIFLTGSGRAEEIARGDRPLRYFPVRLSHRISGRLESLIPADAAALPQAMLTGDRSGLSEADRSQVSLAGASHILAVSGLHVSMLMSLLWLLMGRGRHSALLGLLLLGLFVLMTGASPSVVRAALMLVPVLLAPLVRGESDAPTSLALAGLVLLLWNPWAVADLSFQLSFAAVAGLLLVTPQLRRAFLALPQVQALLRWRGLPALPDPLRGLLLRLLRRLVQSFFTGISASLGALIFTTPITAAVFGTTGVYAVLTNLLILFPGALCLGGALAVLGLGLISTSLGSWAGAALAWIVRLIFWVCRGIARLPGSQLYLDGYGLGFLIFCYLFILLLFLRREKRLVVPLLSLGVALAAALGFQRLEAAGAGFTLAALDVGQGQCICAKTGGFTAVIDCGGSRGSGAGSDAAAWLRARGADRIQAPILTHYDSDHVSGVETLLSLLPVETVYLPEVEGDPENRRAVEQAALANGAQLCYVTENRILPFSKGQLCIFAPVSQRNDNAACLSVLYSVGGYDMLVTGDLDTGAELALLERVGLRQVELYVAGHHGSAGSSGEALLETIRPDTVFISVGRNSYGLPSAKALERFADRGAKVYRTDECGNLEVSIP